MGSGLGWQRFPAVLSVRITIFRLGVSYLSDKTQVPFFRLSRLLWGRNKVQELLSAYLRVFLYPIDQFDGRLFLNQIFYPWPHFLSI